MVHQRLIHGVGEADIAELKPRFVACLEVFDINNTHRTDTIHLLYIKETQLLQRFSFHALQSVCMDHPVGRVLVDANTAITKLA